MRKFSALFVVALLALSMTLAALGCGGQQTQESTTTESTPSTTMMSDTSSMMMSDSMQADTSMHN